MSDIKHPIAFVRDTCGVLIHLGMFDSVRDIKVTESTITLGINSAKFKSTRNGYQVTHRGIILHVFRRDESTGVWSRSGTVPVWWSTDELHGEPARERDVEWEEMCYRPGNKRNPLDGPLARAATTRTRKNGYRGEASNLNRK